MTARQRWLVASAALLATLGNALTVWLVLAGYR